MRIALDGSSVVNRDPGIGRYTYELLRAMSIVAPSTEFVVWPMTVTKPDPRIFPRSANVSVGGLPIQLRVANHIWNTFRIPVPPLEFFLRCDLFHATSYLSPPNRSTPLVTTVHDLAFVFGPTCDQRWARRLKRWAPRTLERSRVVVADSEFSASEIRRWMPHLSTRIRVVYPGTPELVTPSRSEALPQPVHDCGPNASSISDGRPMVLFVGNTLGHKNVKLLFDAAAALNDLDPLVVVAGSASSTPDHDPGAQARASGASVQFLGHVSDQDLSNLYARADVFAFPSLYEGFGFPVVEAMAASTPVVAVDIPCVREVSGGHALLTAPTVEEFSAGLRSAIESPPDTSGGRAHAATFTWQRAAEQMLEIYREVLSDDGRSRGRAKATRR